MPKIVKIYRLLTYLQLATTFQVNGKSVSVTFQYGVTRPFLKRGYFATSDPDLQAAIEADNSFGVHFELSQTDCYDDNGKLIETLAEKKVVAENSTPEAEPEEVVSEVAEETAETTEEEVVSEKTEESPETTTKEAPNTETTSEEVTEQTAPETTEETSPDTAPEHVEESTREEEKPAGPTDYPEVTNLQEARQKMIDLFPTEFKLSNLLNKNALFNRMKDKKITFSKLAL